MQAIIIENGQKRGHVIHLPKDGFLLVGRGQNCHIQIEDELLSRHHFCIESTSSKATILDQRSNNGTFLNGNRIQVNELVIGDEVRAGATQFRYVDEDEAMERGGLFGQTLGGYEIQHLLGRGGMGTVYLARQKSIGRNVALKILSKRQMSKPRAYERFVQEAQAVGQLTHPNIVQAYDFGNDQGYVFFSMEYMAGGSLDELLHFTDCILPIGALALMIDVAKGLAFAETMGIVHRDIKPENLLLDVSGTTKIGDLGIAVNPDTNAEEAKKGLGTPHYMAPEQVLGEEVTHQADIYALGCSLYRMLSGKFPFTGETINEIMQAQVAKTATSLANFQDVPVEVSDLVARMMSKRPVDRPRTEELLRELENLLAQEKARMVEPVSLPAFQPSIGPKTYEQEASDASLPTGLKILVVDDDERILKLVASFLDALGCQAVIFDSPISALEAVPRGEFDLMITDRLMPGMSGDHLAMRVRAIRPRMPILMLTGLGMQMRATGEVPQGVNLVLSKPISLARLQRGISVVLEL